jgi:hypothetical protein
MITKKAQKKKRLYDNLLDNNKAKRVNIKQKKHLTGP